jgi:hypothetical protein
MAKPTEEPVKKAASVNVYVQSSRVDALTTAAIHVNYKTKTTRQLTPSALARYLIDNFLDEAVEKLIADSKR